MHFWNYLLIKEVIGPICVIIGTIVLYKILKQIITKAFKLQKKHLGSKLIDRRRQITLCNLTINVMKYILFIVAIVIILGIFGVNTTAIAASLGAVGVVLGLAFQDVLKDFIAGFTIMLENQYTVGDIVTIGTFKGEVISLSLKTTRVKAYTGEVNIVANRNIIDIVNHSIEDSLAIVDISIAYNEDIDRVENILTNLFKRLVKEIDLLTGAISIDGVNCLGPISVDIRITAPCKAMEHVIVQRILLKEIKEELDKNNITKPFPQVVFRNE